MHTGEGRRSCAGNETKWKICKLQEGIGTVEEDSAEEQTTGIEKVGERRIE